MTPSTPRPVVILLHGLALGAWAMARAAGALRRDGFDTVNLSYRSRSTDFEALAAKWLPEQMERHGVPLHDEPGRVHFVTQSMGGLIVRRWLELHGAAARLGRVVMFAPPNHGTTLVDQIGGGRWFRAALGVNAPRLGTGPDAIATRLGPWPAAIPLGIIAGDRPVIARGWQWTTEPNDGKVTVASTCLEGMADHIVLPYSHTWLQYHGPALRQMRAFLQRGQFEREVQGATPDRP